MIFLDTNVILRFILNDHPTFSPKSESIFQKINNSEVKVYTSWITIFEAVFVLQNSHKLRRDEITKKLLSIIQLENLQMEEKTLLKPTFNNYLEKNISLADAYHVALMGKKKIKKIYSFDEDFDKFPNIVRLEG